MKTTIIQINKLHPFAEHPYKVIDNAEMSELIESIQTLGILTPLIIRPMESLEGEYEIISGHRRLYAAQKAGLTEVPAFVYFIDRDTAAIQLVDSNLHREHLLPSEKAYAYKLKLEAISRRGERNDLTSCQVGTKFTSASVIAPEDSSRQVYRYIRLTNLIPELLELVDSGRMAFTPAVELSYLQKQEQYLLLKQMEIYDCRPSLSQAIRIKKLSRSDSLTETALADIFQEPKANQQEKISFPIHDLQKFFPRSYTPAQIQDSVMKILHDYHKKRQRDQIR